MTNGCVKFEFNHKPLYTKNDSICEDNQPIFLKIFYNTFILQLIIYVITYYKNGEYN